MARKGGCLSGLVKVAIVLVVLVVGALVAGFAYMDSIAKKTIEFAGTKVLGVQTSVQKVSIGVVSASASLATLEVANPEGFKAPKFLALAKGKIAVNASSLMSDVVHVSKIKLVDLNLEFEEKIGGGGSNVDAILANLKKFTSSSGSGPANPSDSGGKKFAIDELTITNVVVNARASGIPLGSGVKIVVPKIQLKSIGSGGKDPVGMDQLVGLIVQAVFQAVLDAGGNQLPAVFAQGMANGLKDIGGFFTEGVGSISADLGKGLQDIGGQIGEGLGGAAKGAGDALKKGIEGIFTPPK